MYIKRRKGKSDIYLLSITVQQSLVKNHWTVKEKKTRAKGYAYIESVDRQMRHAESHTKGRKIGRKNQMRNRREGNK